MERAAWLSRMREITEAVYDQVAPQYYVDYGLTEDATHRTYLKLFLEWVAPGGALLSAACGAGRYDGFLLDAGHTVVGTDQSAGMLAIARQHFPSVRYEKTGLQELGYDQQFDGAICMDALEHVPPEDYPGILKNLARAIKPDGMLYFTADTFETARPGEIETAFREGQVRGLPVVPGELAYEVEAVYPLVRVISGPVPGELSDRAVYHYFAPVEQLRAWLEQAGLVIEAEGLGSGWYHILARKRSHEG